VLLHKLSTSLIRLEFSLELLDADDPVDELDLVLLVDQIFVLSLGIFGQEADRGCRRRGKGRVRQATAMLVYSFVCSLTMERKTPAVKHTFNSHSSRQKLLHLSLVLGVDNQPNMLIFDDQLGLLTLSSNRSVVLEQSVNGLFSLLLGERRRERWGLLRCRHGEE
jgi:hypothetical protein